MVSPVLEAVFVNAAMPQKVVFVGLVVAIPVILIAVGAAIRGSAAAAATVARRTISDMRVAAPSLGLLTGGSSSFHMAETIVRLPFDPTLKQLAPGIFEVSALVSLGALAGIVAMVAHAALRLTPPRQRTC